MNEGKIRTLKDSSPRDFLFAMVEQLNNDSLATPARHLTGILFKNTAKGGDEGPFWFTLSDDDRSKLKEGILMPLASEHEDVRRSACGCVASVACLELPKKMWTDIVPLLCTNSYSKDLKVKNSSLITLGYICEEIEGEVLGIENTNLVISALLESLEANENDSSLMQITMQATYHSIEFAENIFGKGEGGVIIERIIKHGLNSDEEVRKKTMMCLAEIIRCYYDSVDKYMAPISELTSKIIKEDDDEEVATLAIEVWCTVCEGEIEIYKRKNGEGCMNYIKDNRESLIQLVLWCISCSQIDEDDESDHWNRSTASGCCLSLMAQILGDDIIQPVIEFAEGKISNPTEWRDKYLGLLALGAILEGPTKEKLNEILGPAMQAIIGLFTDESRKVRETVAWFFSKIAQNQAEIIGNETVFPTLYEHILNGLKDDSRVACNSVSIINELAKGLKPVDGQVGNILSTVYEQLIERCTECAYRDDSANFQSNTQQNKINIAGFDALYSLFENAPGNVMQLLMQSLEIFYEKLVATFEGKESVDNRSMEFQSFLCLCLQTLLNRIDTQLDTTIADKIVEVIVNCFKSRNDVFEEGFLLLSALCSKFEKHIDSHVPVIGPYLVHALQQCESSETTKNACGLISDLCTMVESQNIIEGFENYVPLLLNNVMGNKALQRDAKLGAVTAIGDTFLITKDKFMPFLDETLKYFNSAAEQCIDVNVADYDLIEYITKLQGALIESYT